MRNVKIPPTPHAASDSNGKKTMSHQHHNSSWRSGFGDGYWSISVVVVVFKLKAVPVSTQYFLTSVLVQLTDADAFRGHRLTTQKGYTYQKYIKGPRKVNTHAIIGK